MLKIIDGLGKWRYMNNERVFAEITVSIWSDNAWAPEETYIVSDSPDIASRKINVNSGLAKAALDKNSGDEFMVGQCKYKLLKIINGKSFNIYVKNCNAAYNRNDFDALEVLGKKLAVILGSSIKIKTRDYQDLCSKVIVGYITNNNLEAALELLETGEKFGYAVPGVKARIAEIIKLSQGYKIHEIQEVSVLEDLARLYSELGSYEKAYGIYQAATRLSPQNTYLLNSCGKMCRTAGMYKEGEISYIKSIKQKDSPIPHTGLGGIYRDMKKFDLAEKSYLKALEFNNNNDYANKGLGAVYFDQGDYDLGEECFTMVRDTNYLFKEVELYRRKGMMQAAVKCLNVILKKSPSNIKAKKLYRELVPKGQGK